jgi:nitrous oxidase accessory protein NosD
MWHRKLLTSCVVALVSVFLVGTCYATELSGKVKWSGQVELQESVIISPGASLTIAPGTQISIANTGVKISVRGLITSNGRADEPVVFKGPSGWLGIEFMEAPRGSSVTWTEFYSAQSALSSFATDFKVENCTFRDGEFGVKLLRESSPVIINSVFENNQVGIANEMKSGPEIRGNRFVNQSRSAILASHNSKGAITENSFEKNKQAITLLQNYQDRIRKNTFVENEVGIYCNQTKSTPLIEENSFERNQYGVLNFSFSYPVIKNNRFVGNKTAVHNDQYGSPLVENNLFRENATALYNYRKSNPKVHLNSFEQNELALFCDFSAYPEVKNNNFLGNAKGVKLGIYQSADWERRSGSKKIMQREAISRKSQNPLLAKAPDTFNDFVDVSGNWWGDDTEQLAMVGAEGNSPLFYDRHDEPEVTYEDYGPGVYTLDRVHFSPWLDKPVKDVGPLESK